MHAGTPAQLPSPTANPKVPTDHKNQYDLSQFDYNEYKKLSSAGHAACLLPA